jgi:hypothetical protein
VPLDAGVGQQPFLHHGCLVRGQVAADYEVDCQAGPGLAVNLVQEVAEVHRPVLGGQLADHRASGGVQCGEQVDGAVPDVIVAAPPGYPGIIGSTGAVRCRAWICGFSSTAKTAAPPGGARYSPTTSRILAMSSGSGETLKSSVRHGCSPDARQMRCTLAREIPTRAASSRFDQGAAPSGTSFRVPGAASPQMLVPWKPGDVLPPAGVTELYLTLLRGTFSRLWP